MTASRVSWEEGSFVRDTLIYRLGILVRAVAITAFADPKVRATYDAWLRQLQEGDSLKPASPSQPLVESGFASGGKLYINPDECIECGACEPACPVEAIYSEYELPAAWESYAAIDALW